MSGLKFLKMPVNNQSPFNVVKIDRTYFKSWTAHLDQIYAKKSTFPSRPLKELKIERSNKKILFRTTYNGPWEEASIAGRNKSEKSPEPRVPITWSTLCGRTAYFRRKI